MVCQNIMPCRYTKPKKKKKNVNQHKFFMLLKIKLLVKLGESFSSHRSSPSLTRWVFSVVRVPLTTYPLSFKGPIWRCYLIVWKIKMYKKKWNNAWQGLKILGMVPKRSTDNFPSQRLSYLRFNFFLKNYTFSFFNPHLSGMINLAQFVFVQAPFCRTHEPIRGWLSCL